jgi:hypothetical protein
MIGPDGLVEDDTSRAALAGVVVALATASSAGQTGLDDRT